MHSVYPGQGAQHRIGRDPADALSGGLKAVFERGRRSLGRKAVELIWEGDADALDADPTAQPVRLMGRPMGRWRALKAEALLSTRRLMLRAIRWEICSALRGGDILARKLRRVAAHSWRREMQAAVPVGQGAMAHFWG